MDDFERKCGVLDQIEKASGVGRWSAFSCHEMFETVDDFMKVVYPNGLTLVYSAPATYGWGRATQITIDGPVTLLELWIASESLIRLSKDAHHIFIEGFMETKNGTIELQTGS